MFEKDRMLQSTVRLVKGANLLGVPMLVTEQYKKGLGPTVPELAGAVPNFAAIEKLAFSACEAVTFRDALAIGKRSDVVLCGIEAHVCVSQTCLELLEGGYRVFVVADAVSSRTAENCRFGLDRMRQAGAVVVSTEMVLFELLEQAGTAEFKQVLGLVK
jgi:nicotinamidase-related amidase